MTAKTRPAWATALLQLTAADSPITYGVVKPGDAGDVLFVRGGDIAGGSVREDQLRTITADVSRQYKRTLLRGGELLISLVPAPPVRKLMWLLTVTAVSAPAQSAAVAG